MDERAAPQDVAQLVADHYAVLYRYAYRLTGSVSDAEDLTQQVFLIAQQKLSQVRDQQGVRSWLFTILRNCYLKSRRQRLPAAAQLDVDTLSEETTAGDIDVERLQTAINGLGDEFKIVILLFYFEHRTYREIAELLDVPPGTIMSRLARAKAHLRRGLCKFPEFHSLRADPAEVERAAAAQRRRTMMVE
jgi:RNA polymerase sigma-70 factor (ECF subfamily)